MTDTKPSADDKIFNQLEQDKLKEEIKAEAVKEAQEALIQRLQGDKPKYSWEEKGKEKPENYDDLFEEIDKRVVRPEDIDKRVEEKLKEKEEIDFKKEEEKRKQQTETIKQKRESFDKDWYELVNEGKMPAPAKEVQEKINKGEQLTKEEIMNDEGLKARLELARVAQNKRAKLAFYEDYGKQPAGARAPVLGARPSAPQTESKELKYEDIAKNRKRLFGY